MHREIHTENQSEPDEEERPKLARRRIYLPPNIGGRKIDPKPTLAQLDGDFEC
jgi:hypothetical protein